MLLLRAGYIIVVGVIAGKLPQQVREALSFPETSLRAKKEAALNNNFTRAKECV
jgi:hypothetical protein